MRISVLCENTAYKKEFEGEHGLSLLISTEKHKILFDAGQTDLFLRNGARLGEDLKDVDMVVLSHGHYDHGGGLARFLDLNATAPVYLNPHAFEPHFNGAEKDIGLDKTLLESGRLLFAEDGQALAPGIRLYSQISCPYGIRPFGLTVREQGRLVPEDFRHEQYLLIEEQGKRILFSGCSHRGILNIVSHFRPDVLVGGFHFMKLDPAGAELEAAAAELKRFPTIYYTGHCTGEAQFERLKERLGQKLHGLHTGKQIVI